MTEPTEPTPQIDQRGQQIDDQINIAHLYNFYPAAPGRSDLTETAFQNVLSAETGVADHEII